MTNISYISLKVNADERGKLIALEKGENKIPFSPQRSFFLYDVPKDAKRAGHAIDAELFIVAVKGNVNVTDSNSQIWNLSSPEKGLFIPAREYIELVGFSDEAVIVVYASKRFDETNYFSFDQIKTIS